jgi:hypothetical protein
MPRISFIVAAAVSVLSTLSAPAWSAKQEPVAPETAKKYAILRDIRSPQDMLYPHFPKLYCVPVTLSGPIADEMKGALDSLKLETPNYNERFNGKEFHLVLANENYSATTRELLGGILNPVDLIDIVVSSVVKYREDNKFSELMRETKIEQESSSADGRPVVIVRLTPRGERFSYTYQDFGTFVHESWLTMLTLTIDPASKAVTELSTIRYSKTNTADGQAPAPDVMKARYLFTYAKQDSVLLPQTLTVFFDKAEVLKITATYRKEGKQFVFDTKEICSSLNGAPSCLKVQYNQYHFTGCDAIAPLPKGQKNYAGSLEKAAELSKEASDKMRQGKITESVRVLQKLIEEHGSTPQAIEAKKLLSQLPKGLQ